MPVVGDSVIHNEKEWTSVTGINTEPGVGSDWKAISEDSSGFILDINSPSSKLNKWVIGTGVPAINNSNGFIGLSTVNNPTSDADFSTFLVSN